MTLDTPKYLQFGLKLHQLVEICAAVQDTPIQNIETEIGSLCKRGDKESAKAGKLAAERAQGYIRNLYRGKNPAGNNTTLDYNLKEIATDFYNRLAKVLRERYFRRLIYEMLKYGGYSAPDALCEDLFGVDTTYFVGIDVQVNELSRKLSAEGTNVVLLSGVGNSGKTTIANRVALALEETSQYEKIISIVCNTLTLQPEQTLVQQIIDRIAVEIGYQQLLLGSAQDTQIERIKHYLEAKRCLLIIDNLEAFEDTQNTLLLVKKWGTRSSFLIVSQSTLEDVSRAFIPHKLTYLSKEHAYEMINAELAQFKRPLLSSADLEKLYTLSGGIPGLLRIISRDIVNTEGAEDKILNDFYQQNLVNFAFGRLWNRLSPDARIILSSMTFVSPHGESEAAIQDLCLLIPKQFAAAWKELKAYDLIQRFRYHGKTVCYLHQTLVVFLKHQKDTQDWFYDKVPLFLKKVQSFQTGILPLSNSTILNVLYQAHLYLQRHKDTVDAIYVLKDHFKFGNFTSTWDYLLHFAADFYAAIGKSREQCELLLTKAESLFWSEAQKPVQDICQKIQDIARDIDELELQVTAAILSVEAMHQLLGLEEASQLLSNLREELQRLPLSAEREKGLARAEIEQAMVLRFEGHFAEALELAHTAVSRYQGSSTEHTKHSAHLHRQRGRIFYANSEYEKSHEDYRLAEDIFRQLGDPLEIMLTSRKRSISYWANGRLTGAESLLKECIEIGEAYHTARQLLEDKGNLGLVYLCEGRLEEGLKLLEEHVQNAKQLRAISEKSRAWGNLALAWLHIAEIQGAETPRSMRLIKWASRVLEYTANNLGSMEEKMAAEMILTRCYRLLNRYQEGRELAERIFNDANAMGSLQLRVAALRSIAEFTLDPDQQAVYLNEALELARGRRLLDEAACLIGLASLDRDQQQWQMGEKLLHEIGAHHWLRGRSMQNPPMIPTIV